LKDWDDEIHKALAHPIRRRIIELLQENDLSFQKLLEQVGVGNHGKLGFHIRSLEGLVERDPSMKRYRLTDRGQLAAELMWDIRFIIDRGGRDLAHEPTRYVRRLKFGDHAFLCYDKEEVKQEIVFSFLEAGLSNKEAVVYLVPEHKLDPENEAAKRYGIYTDQLSKGAFTIMSADEWYLKTGKSKAKTIITNWQTLIKEKQKSGFTGLRAAGDMDPFFNYAKTEELLRYEKTLEKNLPENICGLCIYNENRLNEKLMTQLINCHGHFITRNMAWKTT
jgi:DNA-binding transcriptional ArsR family regulator